MDYIFVADSIVLASVGSETFRIACNST